MASGAPVQRGKQQRSLAKHQLAWVLVCVAGLVAAAALPAWGQPTEEHQWVVQEYPVPAGSRPHDAVPDGLGGVWYAGQGNGTVGRLDPGTGQLQEVALGTGSAPHGIIIGPDQAAWVTDGGLNAIVRVDPATLAVQVYPLPGERANLNTATFDGRGTLWFTGQAGFIGRLDPAVGVVEQFRAPRGRGPYGIATALIGRSISPRWPAAISDGSTATTVR